MVRGMILVAVIGLLVVAGVLLFDNSLSSATHFNPDSVDDYDYTSCGANCQQYQMTLTLESKGTATRSFILQGVKDDYQGAGVQRWKFGAGAWGGTYAYNIREPTSPKTVTLTVETDGGNEHMWVDLYHDVDADGTKDAVDLLFDEMDVYTH